MKYITEIKRAEFDCDTVTMVHGNNSYRIFYPQGKPKDFTEKLLKHFNAKLEDSTIYGAKRFSFLFIYKLLKCGERICVDYYNDIEKNRYMNADVFFVSVNDKLVSLKEYFNIKDN